MPQKSYPFEQNGMERVTISWKAFWKNITINFDGKEVGTIPNQKELQKGGTFMLPDGSRLEVKLARTWWSAELQVLRDGKPLPGSGSDPRVKLKQSYGILYFIGGFNLILGIIAGLFQVDFLLELGIGIYSIITGGVYLLLAFFVQKRSALALGLATGLYAVETALSLTTGFSTGVIVRIFFILFMVQGFKAIKELKAEKGSAIEY